MRPNTPREQLLQNLLAMSSVLLHRACQNLNQGTIAAREALIIDIEEWFYESQQKLEAEIRMEYAVIPERRAVPRPESPPWTPPSVPIITTDAEECEDLFNGKTVALPENPTPIKPSISRKFFDF